MLTMRGFLMQGYMDAIGNMPDYWVILNASGYADKGVLTEDDLAKLADAINAKNNPPVTVDTDEMQNENEENLMHGPVGNYTKG